MLNSGVFFTHAHTTEESENEAGRNRKVHLLQNVLPFQKGILIVV